MIYNNGLLFKNMPIFLICHKYKTYLLSVSYSIMIVFILLISKCNTMYVFINIIKA